MSDRQQKYWTVTLQEAFGNTAAVKKGLEGEAFMTRVFDHWKWEWRLNQSDKKKQLDGLDIEFRSPNWVHWYSADIKANMNQYGTFYVYNWIETLKSDRVFHVNVDTGWIAYYSVDRMRRFWEVNKDRRGDRLIIRTKHRPKWVTARRIKQAVIDDDDEQVIDYGDIV